VFVYARQSEVCVSTGPEGCSLRRALALMNRRGSSCEVMQKPLELKSLESQLRGRCVRGDREPAGSPARCTRRRPRPRREASSPSGDGGGGGKMTVRPIENRATRHYSGRPSSSHRGTETDAYARARRDYDAARCPAILTGLPPSVHIRVGSVCLRSRPHLVSLCCLGREGGQ